MTQLFSMKNRFALVAFLIAAASLVVMTLGLYGNAPSKAADTPAEKKTINISGQAKVSISPDIAYITLGVITENKDAKVAQKENATSMDKVIAAIKASGVKAEDIKTVNYSINPKYNYEEKSGVSNIVGYTVNNSVSVTVRDIQKAGNIIDAAAESGVNASSSISFDVSNYEKYYNEALKKAVLAAKTKADTIAGAMGLKLKAPITISESGGYSPLSNYATYNMKADMAGAATPVQAGSIEITANVNVVYEY